MCSDNVHRLLVRDLYRSKKTLELLTQIVP